MQLFRYSGIDIAVADEVRRTMRSPQYGHPAHREIARGTGPCRLCLRTFAVGREERILFTYQPFLEPGSLPAPGPVFVHGAGCDRYDGLAVPPDFLLLPIVVEGFRPGGQLVVQQRVNEMGPEKAIAEVFAHEQVVYAHLRNGEAGCFMARVDRVSKCG